MNNFKLFWEGKVCEPSLRGVLSDEIQTSRKMTRRGVLLEAFQFQLISKKSLSLEVRSHGENFLSLSLSLSLKLSLSLSFPLLSMCDSGQGTYYVCPSVHPSVKHKDISSCMWSVV